MNCKERVHIVLQMSPSSCGSVLALFSETAASMAEAQITERRVGWGRDTYMGWETRDNQRKERPAWMPWR